MQNAWIIRILLLLTITVGCYSASLGQYFIDVLSANAQVHRSTPNEGGFEQTGVNTWTNLFVPVVRPSGNTLIVRASAEQLTLTNESTSLRLRSLTLPLGVQWKSKNPKWRHTTLIIPKIAGASNLTLNDRGQLGLYWLSQYSFSDSLRVKVGLYINREFFGNLYVPMLGLDWKVNSRWNLYGTLPNSFRCAYSIRPGVLNTGVGFKSMVRSFRASNVQEYIRYNEIQVKYFLEWIIAKKWVAFCEMGYFMGKAPLLYQNNAAKSDFQNSDLLKVMKPFPLLNIGAAWRVFQ